MQVEAGRWLVRAWHGAILPSAAWPVNPPLHNRYIVEGKVADNDPQPTPQPQPQPQPPAPQPQPQPPPQPPSDQVVIPGQEFRAMIGALTEMPGKIAEAVTSKVFGAETAIVDDAVKQQQAPTVKPATEHWFWRKWGNS